MNYGRKQKPTLEPNHQHCNHCADSHCNYLRPEPVLNRREGETMKHAQIISALVLLTTGVILSFIGFFTEPVGEISDSVLWYFAQTLIYAGSVFGLKAYVDKMISSGSLKRPGE